MVDWDSPSRYLLHAHLEIVFGIHDVNVGLIRPGELFADLVGRRSRSWPRCISVLIQSLYEYKHRASVRPIQYDGTHPLTLRSPGNAAPLSPGIPGRGAIYCGLGLAATPAISQRLRACFGRHGADMSKDLSMAHGTFISLPPRFVALLWLSLAPLFRVSLG